MRHANIHNAEAPANDNPDYHRAYPNAQNAHDGYPTRIMSSSGGGIRIHDVRIDYRVCQLRRARRILALVVVVVHVIAAR
jgi:hypothetical protein